MNLSREISTNVIVLCFLIASIATLGSLFFSEIMGFIPCSMCWYQRIFMYPLVLIFLINILYPDDKVFKYAILLVVAGLVVSIYHNLLMFDIIPESIVPCVSGVPCSTEYINWLGFITIPFLSLVSYLMLFILLVVGKKGSENEK
ncbi:MAG: disulfide oxidoreductase [Arcobacteraceae bacterium]